MASAPEEKTNVNSVGHQRPSADEGGDGQQDDVVIGLNLSYGPENRRKHFRSGIQIHTDLFCQYYKEDITCNNQKCTAYKPIRTVFKKTRPTKKNGYREHEHLMIHCSNCHHSVNHGLRFKRI